MALVDKGMSLGHLKRWEEEIAIDDEVEARFGSATETDIRAQVARALTNKGVALSSLGRIQEAIEPCDQIEDRYGDATEPVLRERVANALTAKGYRLRQLGRSEEAVALYDEVEARFSDASEPAIRAVVALALVRKSFALASLGRLHDAILMCDQVVERYGDAPDPSIQEQVARALSNKGQTLAELGQRVMAIGVYDQVDQRFGGVAQPRSAMSWRQYEAPGRNSPTDHGNDADRRAGLRSISRATGTSSCLAACPPPPTSLGRAWSQRCIDTQVLFRHDIKQSHAQDREATGSMAAALREARLVRSDLGRRHMSAAGRLWPARWTCDQLQYWFGNERIHPEAVNSR